MYGENAGIVGQHSRSQNRRKASHHGTDHASATFLSAMKVSEEEEMDCSFAVIDPLLQKNSGVWRMRSDFGKEKIHVIETEDSEGVFPIDALTQLLFGTVPIREIAERTDVMATERLVAELEKICKLNRVFLNEIV